MNLENTTSAGYDFEDVLNNPERLFLRGKCDETILKICKEVGWLDDLNKLIPYEWEGSKNSKEEEK